jgi:hypothetical protein
LIHGSIYKFYNNFLYTLIKNTMISITHSHKLIVNIISSIKFNNVKFNL